MNTTPPEPTSTPRQQRSIYYADAASIVSLPDVEAVPGTPLPNARTLMEVLTSLGATGQPTILRCACEFIGIQKVICEKGRATPDTAWEQVALLTMLIDREAAAHLAPVTIAPDAPINPSSYGEFVFWLAWRLVHYVGTQDDPERGHQHAERLVLALEDYNHLITEAMAGRIRLPGKATDLFPPQLAYPRPTSPAPDPTSTT